MFEGLCLTAVTPTQPDIGTEGRLPEPIALGPNNRSVLLNSTDAYSLYVWISANRAHLTNNLP
jgi:hypothetical protein